MTVVDGVQLQPWSSANALVDLARQAARRFENVWMAEQLQSRDTTTILGAIASTVDVGVGTVVTFPFGHNPLQIAGTFGALTDLVSPGRRVMMGLGTGGAMVGAVAAISQPITRTRELIQLCRRLWNGECVPLGDYPATLAACELRDDARVALNFKPAAAIPIVVTGTGPKILELAGVEADGVLFASNFPPHSLGAFRSGRWPVVSNIEAVERGRAASRRAFTRIYGLNLSLADDRAAARILAKRQAALALWGTSDEALAACGFDLDACRPVKEAFARGEGIDAVANRVPETIADALVISGTTEDCISALAELIEFVARAGFDRAYIGAPIGPDVALALRLLVDEVLPALRAE